MNRGKSAATYRARDGATGAVLADRLRPAHTHWTRLKGLLGTKSLEPGEGLWLKPCNQIHMIGMRYAVDVLFLDDRFCIVRVLSGFAPGKISPRVGGATSVIELPAGTVTSAGLAAEVRIEIEGAGAAPSTRVSTLDTLIANVLLAALYTAFAAVNISAARRTGQWSTIVPLVAQESLITLLFLTRRRSIATSRRPVDWMFGIGGTYLPLLLGPTEQLGKLSWLGQPAQVIGLTLAILGLVFLGRSFALVAANRGIKTAGPYRIIRHPVYAAHILTYVGYAGSYPSMRNCLVVTIAAVSLLARAHVEERFLREEPAYAEYQREVPWRFVPYLY